MSDLKITQLKSEEAKQIQEEIQAALDTIKSKYQLVELKIADFKFAPNAFTCSLRGRVDYSSTDPLEEASKTYFISSNKLPKNFFELGFVIEGERYEILKVELKNSKYPIIAFNVNNGKYYKFSLNYILINGRFVD
ncbi:MAG: hypothetical protein LCH37_11065 [Bacteroidetes bacterium]|nr:hypothetical protein [Bacteroidota bacterium]MCK6611187.1 hypothetical protein [Bacteroidia bacterium]